MRHLGEVWAVQERVKPFKFIPDVHQHGHLRLFPGLHPAVRGCGEVPVGIFESRHSHRVSAWPGCCKSVLKRMRRLRRRWPTHVQQPLNASRPRRRYPGKATGPEFWEQELDLNQRSSPYEGDEMAASLPCPLKLRSRRRRLVRNLLVNCADGGLNHANLGINCRQGVGQLL